MSQVSIVIGAQWGDEGKGKLIDLLAERVDIVARYNGGSNAGHTIVVNGVKYAFHLVPSGVLYDNVTCLLGNGLVVYLPSLFEELKVLTERKINYSGRFFISDRAHLLLDLHKIIDGKQEEERGKEAVGTTRQGIGPCYATKMQRNGIRIGDLLHFESVFPDKLKKLVNAAKKSYGEFEYDIEGEIVKYREYAKMVSPMVIDSVPFIYESIKNGKRFLIEGANANMLDIDFGTYPFVTSSNPIAGGACTGLGIPPSKIQEVIGIVKAYTTRVGEGPFPTEDTSELGNRMRTVGYEFGTTTGRPRRCGWLDIVQLRYTEMLNGMSFVALTKLDVLTGFTELKIGVKYLLNGKEVKSYPSNILDIEKIKVEYVTLPGWSEDISNVRKYKDLPQNAKGYVETVEKLLGVQIKWIGVGPSRDAIIDK